MKAVYKLFSFLGIVLYLLGPLFMPAVALATGPSLVASPQSGKAPLAVTLSGDTGAGCNGGNFTLVFGDGKSTTIAQPADRCVSTFSLTHTYASAGTYASKITDTQGKTLATTQISVTSAAASSTKTQPTCHLQLNTSNITLGGSVTLKWTSTNATGGAITNVGNVDPTGSINLLPSSASYTTYLGSFTGPNGTANCSATVAVTQSNGTTQLGTANPVDVGTAETYTKQAPTTAPASGLVTCGYGLFDGSNSTGSSTGCQACDLATLIQNIINFLIGLSIPVAAALFAWAGVLFFTATDDHHKIDQAKGIFKNAFIGFVIVISAWLVINTVLHVLFSQGEFANGNWFTIQCSTNGARPVDTKIGDVLTKVLGNAPVTNNVISTTPSAPSGGACDTSLGGCFSANQQLVNNGTIDPGGGIDSGTGAYAGNTSAGPGGTCPPGSDYYGASGSPVCLDQTGGQTNPVPYAPNSGVGGNQCNNANCSPGVLQGLNGDGFEPATANAMSCIALTENGGSATGCNNMNACGTFQIVVTVNKLNGPDCAKYNNGNPVLNCPAMCKGNKGVATKNGLNPGDPCNPCVQAANDAQCNAESAQNLYAQDGYSPWLSSAAGGSSDNKSALGCVQKYDPTSDSIQ